MSLQDYVIAHRQRIQITLILQGDQAFWFKWKNGIYIDSFVESILSDESINATTCPWIHTGQKETVLYIELILNTSFDELDRVKTDSHSSVLIQRLQYRLLLRNLRAEFPAARIIALPNYLAPERACILHHVIPNNWEVWLRQLQTQAVTVSHVVTGTELLCDWSGSRGGLRLLVHCLGTEERHLLLDGACPIFMRIVPTADDYTDSQSRDTEKKTIVQTLNHIYDNVLRAVKTLPVVELVLAKPCPSQEFAAARMLSTLYVGQSVQAIDKLSTAPCMNDKYIENTVSERCSNTVGQFCFSPFSVLMKRMIARSSATARRHRWRLSRRSRVASEILSISLQNNRRRTRIAKLQLVTLLCAVVAIVSVAITSVHGFKSSRERIRLISEQERLNGSLESLTQSVSALHQSPKFVSRSLELIDSYQFVKSVGPDKVFAVVADAITRFPSVTLNGLSWVVVDEDILVDETYTSPIHVPGRKRIWSSETRNTYVQIELAGGVIGIEGLRNKQRIVDAFVSYLKNVSGMRVVSILDSPVNAARSSTDLIKNMSNYRVSLVFGAS